MKIAIYGLFSDCGECIYVGQTRMPTRREMAHRNSKQFGEMKILKWVPIRRALKEESRVISEFKSIGQAKLNGQHNSSRWAVGIRPEPHQKAVLASGFLRMSMNDFVSEAIERLADPVLRKHGVKPDPSTPGRLKQ